MTIGHSRSSMFIRSSRRRTPRRRNIPSNPRRRTQRRMSRRGTRSVTHRFNIVGGRVRQSALLGSLRHQRRRVMTSTALRPRSLLHAQDLTNGPTVMQPRVLVDLPRLENAQEQIRNDDPFGPQEEEMLRTLNEPDDDNIIPPNSESSMLRMVYDVLHQPIRQNQEEENQMEEIDLDMEFYSEFGVPDYDCIDE